MGLVMSPLTPNFKLSQRTLLINSFLVNLLRLVFVKFKPSSTQLASFPCMAEADDSLGKFTDLPFSSYLVTRVDNFIDLYDK